MKRIVIAVLLTVMSMSALAAKPDISAQAKKPSAKVTICHLPLLDPDNYQTVVVSESALADHFGHGDLAGPCEKADPEGCYDGNPCTVDAIDGVCVAGERTQVDCNDGNLCTLDECLVESGCVSSPISCGDGNSCTIDMCNPSTGTCENAPKSCELGVCDISTGECEDACLGYTCEPADDCHAGGECSVGGGSPVCSADIELDDGTACGIDFSGTCQSGVCEPSSCDTLTCNANAECIDNGTPACACLPGYEGDGYTCTDIDECVSNACDTDINSYCSNTVGGFECICSDGYGRDANGECADINECTLGTDNCDANAICSNTAGSYTCACDAGYTGDGTTCTPLPLGPPTATDSAESVLEDSGLSSVFSMSGNAGAGGLCRDAGGCTFVVTGCAAGSVCTLSDATAVRPLLPYGYFDRDYVGVDLTYTEDGAFQVTPKSDFYGTVEFKFKTVENGLESAEKTVTVVVANVADVQAAESLPPRFTSDFEVEGASYSKITPPIWDFNTDSDLSFTAAWSTDVETRREGFTIQVGPRSTIDGFKDWRTGGGQIFPTDIRIQKGGPSVYGCGPADPGYPPTLLDATVEVKALVKEEFGACLYNRGDAAGCVHRSWPLYQLKTGTDECKATPFATVHVEASAEPYCPSEVFFVECGPQFRIYIDGVSSTSAVTTIQLVIGHTLPGWLAGLPEPIFRFTSPLYKDEGCLGDLSVCPPP